MKYEEKLIVKRPGPEGKTKMGEGGGKQFTTKPSN